MSGDRGGSYNAFHPAILVLLGLIAFSEYLFVYVNESLGILFALLSTLLIYTLLSLFQASETLTQVVENMSILFIYIILVSALPWFFLKQDLLIPAVYSIVLALSTWRISSINLTLDEVGINLKNIKINLVVGSMIGVLTGVVEYFVLRPEPLSPVFDFTYFLRTTFYMIFFVGLGEELLFRSLIQRSLIKVMGATPGIIWSAVVFSVMHTIWRSAPELLFTFVAGLILGALYHKTGSLMGSILLHGLNNIVLIAVMPYII